MSSVSGISESDITIAFELSSRGIVNIVVSASDKSAYNLFQSSQFQTDLINTLMNVDGLNELLGYSGTFDFFYKSFCVLI